MKKGTSNKNLDWRLHVAEPVLSVTGNIAKKDIFVKALVPSFEFKNRKISFGLPNACALYLGNAFKLYKQAMDLRDQSINEIINTRIPEYLAFAYFEKIMGSVLFAYSSIETFANTEVPDNYYHYKKRKQLFLAEAKNTIERWEPLEVKIAEILPEVLNIESPKGKKEWQRYKELKKVRNRIVHLKSVDQNVKADGQDSIWKILFKEKVLNYPLIAKNLIEYFFQKEGEAKPHWYKNFPTKF
jgi:hypothetical protein